MPSPLLVVFCDQDASNVFPLRLSSQSVESYVIRHHYHWCLCTEELVIFSDMSNVFTECVKKNYSLPDLGDNSACNLADSCTAIDCCFESDFLRRTLHVGFNIDFCEFVILGELENSSFAFTIVDYEWGRDCIALLLWTNICLN